MSAGKWGNVVAVEDIIELLDEPVEDVLGSLLRRVRWLHRPRTQHVVDRLHLKHFKPISPPFSDFKEFVQRLFAMWANRFIGVFNCRKFESQFAVFWRQTAIFLGVDFEERLTWTILVISSWSITPLPSTSYILEKGNGLIWVAIYHPTDQSSFSHNFLFAQSGGEGGRYWEMPACDLRPFYLFSPPTTSFKVATASLKAPTTSFKVPTASFKASYHLCLCGETISPKMAKD